MYVHTPLATTHLTRASLDVAVQALKGAPLGPVKIGETRQQFRVVRKGRICFQTKLVFQVFANLRTLMHPTATLTR